MRFEEMYLGWQKGRLSQEEAAQVLGVCSRTFRRQICRYEDDGLEGLNDKRLTQASHRRAPVDDLIRVGIALIAGVVVFILIIGIVTGRLFNIILGCIVGMMAYGVYRFLRKITRPNDSKFQDISNAVAMSKWVYVIPAIAIALIFIALVGIISRCSDTDYFTYSVGDKVGLNKVNIYLTHKKLIKYPY